MIARDVGFGKNPHAAGLRTSRSHLVGVLVPHLTDIVLSTIYDGIGGQARKHGYQTFVTNTHDEVGSPRRGSRDAAGPASGWPDPGRRGRHR